MYSSSMIGRQWAAAVAQIDDLLAREVDDNGLTYTPDIDDLLERRQRLTDALFYSGEAPRVPA